MEIRISKSAKECVACERPFEHDETMTSLVRIEHQNFVREDYCTQCWNADRATGAFSVWAPRYCDPKVAEQLPPEVFSPMRQVFYESFESQERVEMAKAYLAAQLLRRQKVFRLIKEGDSPEGDMHVILFADRIGNRFIEVRDPNLSYAELEAGRCALLERLNIIENPPPTEENPPDAQTEQS